MGPPVTAASVPAHPVRAGGLATGVPSIELRLLASVAGKRPGRRALDAAVRPAGGRVGAGPSPVWSRAQLAVPSRPHGPGGKVQKG